MRKHADTRKAIAEKKLVTPQMILNSLYDYRLFGLDRYRHQIRYKYKGKVKYGKPTEFKYGYYDGVEGERCPCCNHIKDYTIISQLPENWQLIIDCAKELIKIRDACSDAKAMVILLKKEARQYGNKKNAERTKGNNQNNKGA
jgi:hypothetical protein